MQHECDFCGVPASRIHYMKSGWACGDCYVPPRQQTNVHLGQKGLNKYNKKMTYGDIMHIKTRRIAPDGIVRSHPRWETKEW